MSCFTIPVGICHEMERLCAKFWWAGKCGKRSLHWVSWKGLCKAKSHGGKSFHNMIAFNKALLAKPVWRIIHNPNSLLTRFLKARYFKDQDILDAKVGFNPSFV